jgi:hypothetical protein
VARTRYAVLTLGRPRATWSTEVSRWAAAGVLAIDVVRCVGAEEVRARLAGGRPFSALVIDADLPALDRDLVDAARAAGCATLAVGSTERDWTALGVAAVIPSGFGRDDFLAALQTYAVGLADANRHPGDPDPALTADLSRAWRGRVVAVTGPGGTGASTVAMALAQHLGDDPRSTGHVLLADFRLRAELAMLHGSPDVVPGLSELVEAHRAGRPDGRAVRSLTFDVHGRGYHLLLGLRRYCDWAALRTRAVEAAVDSLARTYRHVVVDLDPEPEGELETGSADLEDRNALTRATLDVADAVVVVGLPGMKGVHSLLRVVADLVAAGVDPARIVPVLNRSPRSPRARAEHQRAFADLVAEIDPGVFPLLHLGSNRQLERMVRDVGRLPASFGGPVGAAITAALDAAGDGPTSGTEPVAIVPGSLGFAGDDLATRAAS